MSKPTPSRSGATSRRPPRSSRTRHAPRVAAPRGPEPPVRDNGDWLWVWVIDDIGDDGRRLPDEEP